MTTAPDIADLYINYRDAIFLFIRRRVLNPGTSPELAEDMCSEVFRKAFEAVQRGANVEHASGWLFQIARNMVIDHYRSKRNHATVHWEDAWDEPSRDLSPYELAASACGCETIMACVESLNDAQAQTIALMIDGCASQNVGAAMGMSVDAGKARLHRGRVRLRELLEMRGYT